MSTLDDFISSIHCNVKRVKVEIDEIDVCFGDIFSTEKRKISFIIINDDYSELIESPFFQNDPMFSSNLTQQPRDEQRSQPQSEYNEEQPSTLRKSVRIENRRKQLEKSQTSQSRNSGQKSRKEPKKWAGTKRKNEDKQSSQKRTRVN